MQKKDVAYRTGAVARLAGPAALAALTLGACAPAAPFDWDFRRPFNTASAARQATAPRPAPDARGVLTYPGYQVALAQRGDTVTSLAQRLGQNPAALASANARGPGDFLRPGEVVLLTSPVAGALPGAAGGLPLSGGAGGIAVTPLTGAPLAAPAPQVPAPAAPTGGPTPQRHRVAQGETAFTIARAYNITPEALAEWNGLGSDMALRPGQVLLIPPAVPGSARSPSADASRPGEGSATPIPPSASKPLPEDDTGAASAPLDTPASPGLGQDRTAASAAQFVMPVSGQILRGFAPPKSLGLDIAAPAGSAVKAAAGGTVAAVTKDTDGTVIVILRHEGGVLTVYGGLDNVAVQKGQAVKQGAAFAKIRAGASPFLHFEVRKGLDAVDPMPYLQ